MAFKLLILLACFVLLSLKKHFLQQSAFQSQQGYGRFECPIFWVVVEVMEQLTHLANDAFKGENTVVPVLLSLPPSIPHALDACMIWQNCNIFFTWFFCLWCMSSDGSLQTSHNQLHCLVRGWQQIWFCTCTSGSAPDAAPAPAALLKL